MVGAKGWILLRDLFLCLFIKIDSREMTGNKGREMGEWNATKAKGRIRSGERTRWRFRTYIIGHFRVFFLFFSSFWINQSAQLTLSSMQCFVEIKEVCTLAPVQTCATYGFLSHLPLTRLHVFSENHISIKPSVTPALKSAKCAAKSIHFNGFSIRSWGWQTCHHFLMEIFWYVYSDPFPLAQPFKFFLLY